MPQQSVRPDILRRWKDDLLAWDGDPSTVDALLLRLEQIAAGHGVSLDHYRRTEEPAADWRNRPEPSDPDMVRERLAEVRERIAEGRRRFQDPTEREER